MQNIKPFGSFTPQAAGAINSNFASLAALCRNVYYVDPAAGNDSNDGQSQATAWRTPLKAYTACEAGKNDAVALVANGATSATWRNDTSFTWGKDETHLLGICSGVNISNRARIAPSSTTTAFTPFFTISANGCRFDNIQIFDGFTTGTTSQIAIVLSGSRNLFTNCHLAGMGDTTSATSAGSRSLKITGGENQFVRCTLGIDTVTRTGANATVEFASGCARNVFEECYFPIYVGSGGAPLHAVATGNASMDRFQLFNRCLFINAVNSAATTQTAALSCSTGSPGGMYLAPYSTFVGCTKIGDTNGLTNTFIDGAAPTAGTSGLAVNPS